MKSNGLLVLKLICFAWVFLQTPAVHCADPYMQFGDTGIIYDAEYSPDGTMIAVGTSTGFQIVDASSYEIIHQEFTENKVRIVKWFPDNERLFVVFESFTPTTLYVERMQSEYLQSYSTDHMIFDVNQKKMINFFNARIRWQFTPTFIFDKPMDNHLYHKNSIGFSPNSSLMTIINESNQLDIYNINTLELVDRLSIPNVIGTSTGISNDGDIIWFGTTERDLNIYNVNTLDIIDEYKLATKHSFNSSVIYYSHDKKYAISDRFQIGGFVYIDSMYFHDLTKNEHYDQLALGGGTDGITRKTNIPPHLFHQTTNEKKIVLEIDDILNFDTSIHNIRLIDGSNPTNVLKQDYESTFFSEPFSPDGDVMLTNGYFKPTSDLYSIGALSDQPLTRILPQKHKPTVFDFHPTEPDTILTYSTNQNTTGESILEMWHLPTKSVIYSNTDVVMYEQGTFSDDGSLFLTIDQPFEADPNRVNIWETVFKHKIWEYAGNEFHTQRKLKHFNISPNGNGILYQLQELNYISIETGMDIYPFQSQSEYASFSDDGNSIYLSSCCSIGLLDFETNVITPYSNEGKIKIFLTKINNTNNYLQVDQTGLVTISDIENNILIKSFGGNLGSSSKCNSDDRNRIIQKVYEKQESYEVDG